MYLDVSNQYEQTRIQVASRSAELQVIDQAVVPDAPVSPNVLRSTILAVGLALVAASAGLLLWTAVRREPLRS